MQLVDAIELVLDRRGFIGSGQTEPHVVALGGMLIVGVESRSIDRLFGSRALFRGHVAGRDDVLDGIGERFGGEAPHIALEDGEIGGAVDLVDTPVVGRLEIEHLCGIEGRARLVLADEYVQRIAATGGVDVFEGGAEIDVVGDRFGAGLPAQDDLTRDVDGAAGGGRLGGGRSQGNGREIPVVDPFTDDDAANIGQDIRHLVEGPQATASDGIDHDRGIGSGSIGVLTENQLDLPVACDLFEMPGARRREALERWRVQLCLGRRCDVYDRVRHGNAGDIHHVRQPIGAVVRIGHVEHPVARVDDAVAIIEEQLGQGAIRLGVASRVNGSREASREDQEVGLAIAGVGDHPVRQGVSITGSEYFDGNRYALGDFLHFLLGRGLRPPAYLGGTCDVDGHCRRAEQTGGHEYQCEPSHYFTSFKTCD